MAPFTTSLALEGDLPDSTMKRWELEVLVDYLRGLGGTQTQAAIEADLEAGSPELANDLELLRETADVLRADLADGPSANALRAAVSIFELGEEKGPTSVPLLPFQIRSAPASVLGLRDLESGHRDVRLEGERFELVLSIDVPPGGVEVVVVGRLVAPPEERWVAEGVPVALVVDDHVLATSETNRFGEFHIECESEDGDAELRLSIAGVGRVRFPIDRPSLGEPL